MKRLIFCAVIIIIMTLTGCSNSQSIMQQVNDIMNRAEVERSEIFHYELIQEGILVFYTSGDKLSIGIVGNTKGGLRWDPISGTDLHPSDKLSFAGSNRVEIPLYIIYGVIKDDGIFKVKYIDEDYESTAKIVTTDSGLRIWFCILDRETGPANIKGYSNDGDVLFEY